jgi:hypothetical protein
MFEPTGSNDKPHRARASLDIALAGNTVGMRSWLTELMPGRPGLPSAVSVQRSVERSVTRATPELLSWIVRVARPPLKAQSTASIVR